MRHFWGSYGVPRGLTAVLGVLRGPTYVPGELSVKRHWGGYPRGFHRVPWGLQGASKRLRGSQGSKIRLTKSRGRLR